MRTPTAPELVVAENAVFDPERNWSIYTCSNGCLHLMIDRVMVTLSREELHALQHLIRMAASRFQPPVNTGTGHAH